MLCLQMMILSWSDSAKMDTAESATLSSSAFAETRRRVAPLHRRALRLLTAVWLLGSLGAGRGFVVRVFVLRSGAAGCRCVFCVFPCGVCPTPVGMLATVV